MRCNDKYDNHKSIEERFWFRVNKTSTCWLWTGRTAFYGYGIINHNKQIYRSNRLSYELNVGAIPRGLFILHTCDVTACVNPEHLYAGTQGQNVRDTYSRHRDRPNPKYGEQNHQSTITTTQVIEIRRRASLGETFVSIALDLGVKRRAVSDAATGRTWKHVNEPLPSPEMLIREMPKPPDPEHRVRGSKVGTSKLNEIQVREIKRQFIIGKKIRKLARDFNVSSVMIGRIVNGKNWKHVTVDQD